MGPKSENVEKTQVLLLFFEGQGSPTPLPPTLTRGVGLSLFEVSKNSKLEYFGDRRLLHHPLGLAATRAVARFIPFGGAGRGPVRDNGTTF